MVRAYRRNHGQVRRTDTSNRLSHATSLREDTSRSRRDNSCISATSISNRERNGSRSVYLSCRVHSVGSSGAPDDPTEWTRQLKYTDLEPFRSLFEIDVAEMQLLSRLERLVSSRRLVAWLKRLDVSVLRTCPWLRRYARTIVVELRRR